MQTMTKEQVRLLIKQSGKNGNRLQEQLNQYLADGNHDNAKYMVATSSNGVPVIIMSINH